MTTRHTTSIAAADRPVPFTLTARAHAALAGPCFPPVVCLCGSTQFVNEFNRQRKALTEQGQIVLAVEVVTTQARENDPQHVGPALKARLDWLHKRKIDLADYVLILNVGGYVGPSTRSEITYALATHTPVTYLEPPAPHVIPAGQWACQECGAAFFGTAPAHGLCPGCAACVGVWSGAVQPDVDGPDGICGYPAESEPCPEHAPPGGDAR